MSENATFTDLGQGIWCIDSLYMAPGIACCYLIGADGEYALIETGTARSVDNVLATLGTLNIAAQQVRYVIPTHVHLDHAGGAGQLMRHFTEAKLLIHPRGARHMVDPTRLVESSLAVYGAKTFARLYGEILPVASKRVETLEDGELVSLAGRELEVAHTRGHADHHFCLFDRRTEGWFTGDMYGISYQRLRLERGAMLLPATTPTQFDPEAYKSSLDRLAARQPKRCYLTHFGAIPHTSANVERLKAQLDEYAELVACDCSESAIQEGVVAIAREQLLTLTARENAERLAETLAMDAQLNAQGILWRRRHLRAAAS